MASYINTFSLNRLMINVIREIKPCHNPIKKPAGSAAVNFSLPGAQDVRMIATARKAKNAR